jgi:anti-sigma factor RsiW
MGKADAKHAKHDRVQRYFDGELSAAERAQFEAQMTDADRERLAALGELRALVGNALEAEAAAVDLWPGVEAALAAQAQKKSLVRRWRERVRRRATTTGAGLLVAAVATLLFLFMPWNGRHNPENDCDVESLEVDGALATVLKVHDVPHKGDDTTTIIWSEED